MIVQLVKNYANTQEVTRYSPAKIISTEKRPQFGNPGAVTEAIRGLLKRKGSA